MVHPLVTQLRFARSEFVRGLEGVSPDEGILRLEPMNSISWFVGHLANQEHFYWVVAAQDERLAPDLNDRVGYGKPPSTPPLDEMWSIWRTVTGTADRYLDTLSLEDLDRHLEWLGKPFPESIGTLLLRNTYHYWFHLGQAYAIRQQLGHEGLPEFVGDLSGVAYQSP